VEVEVDAPSQVDVAAIVAMERRLHLRALAVGAEQPLQDFAPLVLLRFAHSVQGLAQVACAFARADEFRIERVIQLTGEHLFALGVHRCAMPGGWRTTRGSARTGRTAPGWRSRRISAAWPPAPAGGWRHPVRRPRACA